MAEPTTVPAAPADADTTAQYLSPAIQVTLEVQERLLATWPIPQPIAAIVPHTGGTRDQVYRALRNLAVRGHAEEQAGGWLAGPSLTTMGERLRARLVSIIARYMPGDAQ